MVSHIPPAQQTSSSNSYINSCLVTPVYSWEKKSNMERNVANIYSFTYFSLVKQGEYLRHQEDIFLPANEKLIPEQNKTPQAFSHGSLSLFFFFNQLLRNFSTTRPNVFLLIFVRLNWKYSYFFFKF